MSIWTASFWKAATERAIKTAAQSAILVLAAEQVNVLAVDWVDVGGFAAGGFALSLLTSLGSARFAGSGPSLANKVAVPKRLG